VIKRDNPVGTRQINAVKDIVAAEERTLVGWEQYKIELLKDDLLYGYQ
jgi:hypothetical protein